MTLCTLFFTLDTYVFTFLVTLQIGETSTKESRHLEVTYTVRINDSSIGKAVREVLENAGSGKFLLALHGVFFVLNHRLVFLLLDRLIFGLRIPRFSSPSLSRPWAVDASPVPPPSSCVSRFNSFSRFVG